MLHAVLFFGVLGGLVGVGADRLSARWPAHRGGGRRAPDWRTVLVALAGTAAFGGLALRYDEPRDLALLGVYFAALILLLATDLDQKLLPDRITLPLIPFAVALLVLDWNPLVGQAAWATALVAALAAPVFLFVTNLVLKGGLGVGDLKLAVSLGLMSGLGSLVFGFVVASAVSSVVLIALLISRTIGMKTAIPFGPILIAAGIVAALLA